MESNTPAQATSANPPSHTRPTAAPSGERRPPMDRPHSHGHDRRPQGGGFGARRRGGRDFYARKACKFCIDRVDFIDYKDISLLRGFITGRGRMVSSRVTGVCAYHQRKVTNAVKRARSMALLPYRMM
ncbi:30S ribosomal protein S18 [Elusimicrobiota bacterium]